MASAPASEVSRKPRRSMPGWWGRRGSGVNVEDQARGGCVEPSALLDATGYDEGCRVAVEAFSDSCLGAAFGQERIHGGPHVRFIAASHNSETNQTNELRAVSGQEGVDLDHANTLPTFPASRVSAASGAASGVSRNMPDSEPTSGSVRPGSQTTRRPQAPGARPRQAPAGRRSP